MPHKPKRLERPEELADKLIQAFLATSPDQRLIVAIAGAPASGKSTLADWLVAHINAQLKVPANEEPAIVVPMDGYHLDNAILGSHGWQAVKGAPHTFDVAGFQALINRLRAPLASVTDGANNPIYIPVFDRSMDLARCAASAVRTQHRLIVVEGNYLLLERPGWRELAGIVDLSVMLDVPLDILKARLIERWTQHGMAADAARERALSNDIPNAITVTDESSQPQFVLTGMRQ